MDAEPDLSDILLRTFLARRDLLRDGLSARAIAILGSELSADSLALRTFAVRQRLPHLWLDADSAAGRALAASTEITAAVRRYSGVSSRLKARRRLANRSRCLQLRDWVIAQ
jgi:thioredoxin reductase (NADPH)